LAPGRQTKPYSSSSSYPVSRSPYPFSKPVNPFPLNPIFTAGGKRVDKTFFDEIIESEEEEVTEQAEQETMLDQLFSSSQLSIEIS
jgi:hypothetical protein